MDELQVKMKLWVDAITDEKMDDVANQLEEMLGSQMTEKKNKLIFKLLLYLSHTAHKCDKSKLELGLEIWRIGCCICSNMTDIPDARKFYSSIYHIASCLLDMTLYTEALEICDYLLPGRLWKNVSSDCADMYSKVSSLLHHAALKIFKKSKLLRRKNYVTLIRIIKYELDITKLAHESCWRYILTKILTYFEKLETINEDSGQSIKEEFTNTLLTYVSSEKMSLDDENKEHTYRTIFLIITELIVKNVNQMRIESVGQTLIRYFGAFRSCLEGHGAYLRCFNLYERLSTTLVKPLNNLGADFAKDITACTHELRRIVITYGYGDAIKWYTYSAVLLISELLTYWEERAKSNQIEYLTNEIMVATMKFLIEQSNIFECYEVTNCRCNDPSKCKIRYDIYNNVALRLKGLSVVGRIFANSRSSSAVSEEMYNLAVSFCEECETGISAMKDSGCKQWLLLWPVCGAHIYNIGLTCESKYHEKSVQLYSLLCLTIVKLEGEETALGKTPSLLNLRDPFSTLLHRLTSVHFNNRNYEEAMIVCSLNGLINSIATKSGEKVETKAFIKWSNIQQKNPKSRELTMMECLRLNKQEIRKIIDISFNDYDLVQLCFCEIKGLADSKIDLSSSIIRLIDEIKQLSPSATIYAQSVQLLGYHLLNFQTDISISKYLRKATMYYERERQPNISFQWCYGHIKFHEFCQKLRDIGHKTENEMKSAKFALSSTKNTSHETGSAASESENIVPAYSTINMKITREIALSLEESLYVWKKAINANKNYKDILENWEITQSLEVLMITGEYARFYNFESLEIESWKMAYNLARELEKHREIIYITSRSLSSQQIDPKWIEEAEKSVEIIEKSNDTEINETITAFKLSLADLYYQNDNPERAKKLYHQATSKLDENFMSDVVNYLLSSHIKMNQCSLDEDNDNHMNYTRIIVQCLYTMLSIDDSIDLPTFGCRKRLYNCDLLFEFTNNLAPRLNSLLSFREISAHLVRRLSKAQKLAASLRVAECLKSLCYIDLTRAKLDDCEVKLQGLEHILEIEDIDLSIKNQIPSPVASDRMFFGSSTRLVEAVRDAGQNDTSPVLRDKIFATPDFILHGDVCTCFKCTNSRYKSLVFASTHLRAQLFSLRRNVKAALKHFEGALMIKKNILSRALDANRHQLENKNNCDTSILRFHRHLDVVEFIVFHLDYCRFLKWSAPERAIEGIEVALDALDLCEEHNLKNHPVYASTNQLIFEYRFEFAYGKEQFSKFTVPAIDEIDIGRYIHEPTEDPNMCVTPARENVAQKAISVRRMKAQPFLKLEKVPIDLTEEEPPISTSPPPRTRPIRRRNLTDSQKDTSDTELNDRKKSIVPRIELSADDDQAASVIVPKRSNSTGRKPANIEVSGSSRKIDKSSIDEIGSELTLKNPQSESSTKISNKSRKTTQRGTSSSKNNSGSSTKTSEAFAIPTIKIDEVTELLSDLTVTKTRPCSSNTGKKSEKISENVITVPFDETISCSDEITVESKRSSLRLRKKSQELSSTIQKNRPRELNHSASNSEDEVVIIETRSRRRVASITEQTAAVKESSKSSRSKETWKRST